MKSGLREFLFASLIIGLLGCSWYFVFSKVDAKCRVLRADSEAKETAMANLIQATSGIADIDRKLSDLQQAISFFESKLPQEREIDKILREVWQLAERNNLETQSVKTLRSERFANYSEQPIQMNLSGDFNGFYNFLLQLEKLPRLTRVSQMKLSKIDEKDGHMTALITLSIYFVPDLTKTSVAGAN